MLRMKTTGALAAFVAGLFLLPSIASAQTQGLAFSTIFQAINGQTINATVTHTTIPLDAVLRTGVPGRAPALVTRGPSIENSHSPRRWSRMS
jgi:hypothetical protein